MYRHVLIATDGSELSRRAIQHGVALASAIHAKVSAINVSPPLYAFEAGVVTLTPEQYAERMRVSAEQCLGEVADAARAAGLVCKTFHVEHDQPHKAIIETAEQNLCDLIVMGSHGRRGVSAIVLGSETVKVLTHSTIPVLVIRPPSPVANLAAS